MSEAAGDESKPTQELELQVHAPPLRGSGLKEARRELEAIDSYLTRIQRKFTEVGRRGAGGRTGTADLEAQLRKLGVKGGSDIAETARKLGILSRENAAQFARITEAFRRNNPTQFRSPDQANGAPAMARILDHFQQRMERRQAVYDKAFRNYLFGGRVGPAVSPRVSEVQAVAGKAARVDAILETQGQITLTVPANRITAVLGEGAVAASGGAGGGGRTGGGLAAETDLNEGEKKTKKLLSGATIGDNPNQAAKRIVSGRTTFSTTVRDILADGRTLETTFDRKGARKKTVETINRAQQAREDFLDKLQGEMDLLAKKLPKQRRGRGADSLMDLAQSYGKAAEQLGGELAKLTADQKKVLGRSFTRKMGAAVTNLRTEAETVLGLAVAAEKGAGPAGGQRRQTQDVLGAIRMAQAQDREELRTNGRNQTAKNRARAKVDDALGEAKLLRAQQEAADGQYATAKLTQKEAKARARALEDAGWQRGKTEMGTAFGPGASGARNKVAFSKEEGGRRYTETFTEIMKNGRLARVEVRKLDDAIKGLSGGIDSGKGFLANTEHITRWAASVGALYGSLAVARSGLQAYLDLSYEVARLDQVYNKVGGSTDALANSVLKLAANEGRGAKEALQSATSWARLGLTRLQIQEAVRVSLVASNVAELDTLEATKYLQSTMAAYGLQVRQLSGFLSGLNDVSNKFNVTNADLLEGISKTASVAKQAGIPLAELRGLVGAAVGTTGQSGANIGNALKSIIVALSNPVLQKTLRSEFKLDTMLPDGSDLKNFSALLGDLFVRYNELNDAERQNLLFQVAGKTQASKMAGFLDSYIQALQLAANSLLNLNSAEQENAKIKGTLRNELAALVAEFDQLALNQTKAGPLQAMSVAAGTLRNTLALLNLPGVNVGITVLVALLGTLAARLLLTKDAAAAAGAKIGYGAKSWKELTDRVNSLGTALTRINGDFSAVTRRADKFLTTVGRLGMKRGFAEWQGGKSALAPLLGAVRGRDAGEAGRAGGFAAAGMATGAGRMALSAGGGAGGFGLRVGMAGAASMAAILPELVVGMTALYAITKTLDVITEHFGLSTRGAEKSLANMGTTLEGVEQRAEAARIQLRMLDIAARALSNRNLRPGLAETVIGGLEGLEGQDGKPLVDPKILTQLRDMAGKSSQGEIEAVLGDLRAQRIDQMQADLVTAAAEMKRESDELTAKIKNTRDPMERQKLKNQQMALKNSLFAKQEELNTGEFADAALAPDKRKLVLLEQQRAVLETIATIYENLGSVDPVTKHQAKLAAARAQQRFLEEREKALLAKSGEFDQLRLQAVAQAAAKRAEAAKLEQQLGLAGPLKKEGLDATQTLAEKLTSPSALMAPVPGYAAANQAVRFAASFLPPEETTVIDPEAWRRKTAVQVNNLKNEADLLEKSGIPLGASATKVEQLETRTALDANRQVTDENEQKVKTLADPKALEAAQFQSKLEQATRDQRAQNQAYGVGDNDGERLLDRRNRLLTASVAIQEQATREAEAAARLIQMQVDLLETENQLRERGYKLETDLAQAKRDSAREFNRNFMESDAASRLKILAAQKAVQLGFTKTAGGFMGLGDLQKYLPDADRPYGRVAELQQEQRALSGRPVTPYKDRITEVGKAQDIFAQNPDATKFLVSLGQVSGATEVALKGLEKSTNRLGQAFDRLSERVDALRPPSHGASGSWELSDGVNNPAAGGKR